MKPNIRERGQKVADYIKTNVNQTLAAIAAATGVSKSSVHRHQQSIEQRQLRILMTSAPDSHKLRRPLSHLTSAPLLT